MALEKFYKQPGERFPITIDFSDVLGTGETISNATIVAYDESDDSVVTSTVIDSYQLIDSNTKVQIKVKAGETRSKYKISTTASTSNANDFEKDVRMVVENE